MEELELKHLAPYLPYKLMVKVFDEEKKVMNATNSSSKNWIGIGACIKWSENCKPILRPMSDITKEITLNNKTFVPLEVLGQKHVEDGFFEDGSFGWGQSTVGDDEQDYYLTVSNNEGFYLVFDIWCGHKDEGGYCVDTEYISFPLV